MKIYTKVNKQHKNKPYGFFVPYPAISLKGSNQITVIQKGSEKKSLYAVKECYPLASNRPFTEIIDPFTKINYPLKKDDENEALLEEFLVAFDLFVAKFINLFNKELTPPVAIFNTRERLFDPTYQKVTGTKYFSRFKEWANSIDIEGNENSFDGFLINSEGYVVKPQGAIPFKDLGTAATLLTILLVGDTNIQNFGTDDRFSHYQIHVLDLESALSDKERICEKLDVKNFSEIKTPQQILSNFFDGNDEPVLPVSLLNAKYVHEEIFETLMRAKTFFKTGEAHALLEECFKNKYYLKNMAEMGDAVFNLLKDNTENLYKQLNPYMIENLSYKYPYEPRSTPSYVMQGRK